MKWSEDVFLRAISLDSLMAVYSLKRLSRPAKVLHGSRCLYRVKNYISAHVLLKDLSVF